MSKYTEDDLKVELENKEYEYGFYTDIESDTFPIGLNEDIVRAISLKKEEPEWMTEWRLEAFRAWQEMTEPAWANVHYEKPDFQAISYYSAPKQVDPNKSLDDVDPELLAMYKKLVVAVVAASVLGVAPLGSWAATANEMFHKEFVKDSVITTKVKAKLAAEKLASLATINVDTDADGVVYLSGTTATFGEISKAISIAKGTDGVKSVMNNLKVAQK